MSNWMGSYSATGEVKTVIQHTWRCACERQSVHRVLQKFICVRKQDHIETPIGTEIWRTIALFCPECHYFALNHPDDDVVAVWIDGKRFKPWDTSVGAYYNSEQMGGFYA